MKDGIFSTSFFSLQLQLKNLFEGIGGEDLAHLLDSLAALGAEEQKCALKVFGRAVAALAAGNERYLSAEDHEQKELIDSLCSQILGELRVQRGVKLEV